MKSQFRWKTSSGAIIEQSCKYSILLFYWKFNKAFTRMLWRMLAMNYSSGTNWKNCYTACMCMEIVHLHSNIIRMAHLIAVFKFATATLSELQYCHSMLSVSNLSPNLICMYSIQCLYQCIHKAVITAWTFVTSLFYPWKGERERETHKE